uniref:Uncharacterized protein n=1 Tax=Nelumbo nucifera TaxID=4432 RepID=A0A823A3Y7_NELNU|nr:TPA_asm: hypothetical protein HUJ06_018615 [Nelumbo nucifera]
MSLTQRPTPASIYNYEPTTHLSLGHYALKLLSQLKSAKVVSLSLDPSKRRAWSFSGRQMAKGDDAIRRKKNKVIRKRMQKDSSVVSARVAAIIAAKQCRKSGKRRICEGMRFTLPTLEDPFNRHGSAAINIKKNPRGLILSRQMPGHLLFSVGKEKRQLLEKGGKVCGRGLHGNSEYPPKFLILCLNSIQNALLHDGVFNRDIGRPLMFNMWGAELWKFYSTGSDILETTGTCSTEQIAWVVSTAADAIARKEERRSIHYEPLLFIPCVRSICKPLKALGIHTVSLHPGASLEHQIHGLKSCEPGLTSKGYFVIDGLETFVNAGVLDKLKSIRQSASGDPQTIIFNDSFGHVFTSVVQNLLMEHISRLCLSDSATSQSAFLEQACGNQPYLQLCKVLFVVKTHNKSQALLATLRAKGYFISNETSLVVIIDFLPSIDEYIDILTRMLRHTVNGVLHSFFYLEDPQLVKPLVEILEQCDQTVPKAPRNLYDSKSTLDQ